MNRDKQEGTVAVDGMERGSWMKECGKRALQFLPQDAGRAMLGRFFPENLRRLAQRRQDELGPLDRHHCIFVHVPKCAGTAISECLFGKVGGHYSIRYYRYMYSRAEMDACFKFTFVRNPWDRVVSAYHYLREPGRVGADLRWRDAHLARFAGFEEFVLTGLRRREVQDWLHFVPQWDFLSVPWSSKPQVDFIGHFETMEQDFAAVAARLGLAASLEVRNSTKSRDRDYRRYYTAASRRVVESVYARDIRALGYEF